MNNVQICLPRVIDLDHVSNTTVSIQELKKNCAYLFRNALHSFLNVEYKKLIYD